MQRERDDTCICSGFSGVNSLDKWTVSLDLLKGTILHMFVVQA